MTKTEYRSFIRARKQAMTDGQIAEKSRRLAELFTASELYLQAKSVYGYLSVNQEVRTIPILERAIADGKRVAIPKCVGDEMKFIWMDDLTQVKKGFGGIPEPIAEGPVADDETALVLVPGLAFDRDGSRIGYGGGFYDKFLARERSHPTLALCFDFQMFNHLETDAFDIPVDCVLWV